MLEIFGEDGFGKEFFVGDNESNAIGSPLDADIIFYLLS